MISIVKKKPRKIYLIPMTTQKMSLETLPGIVTKLIGQIITLQNAKAEPRDFVGKNKIKHISLCEISCLKIKRKI